MYQYLWLAMWFHTKTLKETLKKTKLLILLYEFGFRAQKWPKIAKKKTWHSQFAQFFYLFIQPARARRACVLHISIFRFFPNFKCLGCLLRNTLVPIFETKKKWHFWWQNQISKTTFIVQTFPKYCRKGFYFMKLSLLSPILAILQFCWFLGLFWAFFPCKKCKN